MVTVKDKFTAEGYEVSDWTAEGVTITDDKVIADSPISADYSSTITLPEQPEHEGYTFYWKTADDTLIPDGEYTIPAKDTEVYSVYTEKTFKAYFYLKGEDEPYYVEKTLVKGSKVQITNYPDKKRTDRRSQAGIRQTLYLDTTTLISFRTVTFISQENLRL